MPCMRVNLEHLLMQCGILLQDKMVCLWRMGSFDPLQVIAVEGMSNVKIHFTIIKFSFYNLFFFSCMRLVYFFFFGFLLPL